MGYCYSALFVKEWLVIPVCDIVIVCCLSRVVSDSSLIGLFLRMVRIFFFYQAVITKSILEDPSLLGCDPVIGQVFCHLQRVLEE